MSLTAENQQHRWVKRGNLVDSRTSVTDVKFGPKHLGLILVSSAFLINSSYMNVWIHIGSLQSSNCTIQECWLVCCLLVGCLWLYVLQGVQDNTHTHTHNRLTAFCPGLPGYAGTRRNIHPLTPILIIGLPLSSSSIYNDPWHPLCSVT